MLGVPGPRYVRLAKQFSEDITVQRTALPGDILLFDKVVDEDAQDVVGVGHVDWRLHVLQLELRVDAGCIAPNRIQPQEVLVPEVYPGYKALDVNGNNALVPSLMAAWIRNIHDLGPLDVVSLPSGFSLNFLILSWHGHFSVNTISHMSKISLGCIWKEQQ
jgi:hypothetical protein